MQVMLVGGMRSWLDYAEKVTKRQIFSTVFFIVY